MKPASSTKPASSEPASISKPSQTPSEAPSSTKPASTSKPYWITSAGARPHLMHDFRAITNISFNTIEAYIHRYYI